MNYDIEENQQNEFSESDPRSLSMVTTERCCSKCMQHNSKLHVYNWLQDFDEMQKATKMVEVQFKNTRKDYFINSNDLELHQGDVIAVEAFPGHDIGIVTLTGKLVLLQMKKNRFRPDENGLRRIYRHARGNDLEKYELAKAREVPTMIRSREIAKSLDLNMKIGDVEFQGDGNKAIFYYIADGRVDFRQLIKLLASEFRIKIEMRQIGARQEAGRIGGVGPCGRQLCCSGWMNNFVSVSTSAARIQDISINPQKLAGQCAKLKCCLNYEVDVYVESRKKLPSPQITLETKDCSYFHFKTDVLSGIITYSTDKNNPVNLVSIAKERVFEIISMNKKGKKPFQLSDNEDTEKNTSTFSGDLLHDQSITRFDEQMKPKQRKKRKPRSRKPNESGSRKQSSAGTKNPNEKSKNKNNRSRFRNPRKSTN